MQPGGDTKVPSLTLRVLGKGRKELKDHAPRGGNEESKGGVLWSEASEEGVDSILWRRT